MFMQRLIIVFTFVIASMSAAHAGVNGVVVDATGKPVSNADVVLYYARSLSGDGNRLVEKAVSGDDGKFAFSANLEWEANPPAGQLPPRFSVIARKADAGMGYVNLGRDDRADGITVKIEGRETTTPAVVDGDGKPMAGARVWIYVAVPQKATSGAISQILFMSSDIGFGAISDEKGQAQLIVPPGMQYYIAASKDGFARSFGDKQIVLVPGATVKGTVTGADGKPLANAQVTLSCRLIQGLGDMTITTDAQGKYEIKDIPAQGYRVEMAGQKKAGSVANSVTAEHPGQAMTAASETFNPNPGDVVIKDLVMAKALMVSGKVVDADTDAPLPGIMVSAYVSRRNIGGGSKMFTTDAQGMFRIPAQPGSSVSINCQNAMDGSYLMDNAWGGMRQYASVQNLKEDKNDVTLKIKLRKLAPLSGKVVDAVGKPVGGISVFIDSLLPPAKTLPDGTFTMKKAPTDRAGMILAISDTDGGKADLKAGQSDVTIQVFPRRERQCIAINGEGTPAANLAFTYAPAAGTSEGSALYALNAPAQTDAQGKCTLKLIPNVSYRFSWSGQNDKNRDYSDDSAMVSVSADDAKPIQFVAKQYLNALFIKFQNSKGEPIPDVQLQVSSWDVIASDQRNNIYNLKSDKDGTIQLNRLAKGILRFQAYASGNYRQSLFAVSTEDPEVACILHTQNEPAAYSVLVMSDKGPVPHAKLTVFTRKQGKISQEQCVADEKGIFNAPASDRPTEKAIFCDDPENGWGSMELDSYMDGVATLSLHKPGDPLQLQFVDARKKPVVGAKVRISSLAEGKPGEMHRQLPHMLSDDVQTSYGLLQVTDSDGRVSFPRVDTRLMGSYSVQSSEFGTQHKQLPASGGDKIVELVKLAKLHGKLTVKDVEKPDLNGINIMVRNDRGSQGSGLRTGGAYQIEQLQPGTYTVSVDTYKPEMRKYKLASKPRITLAPGNDTILDLQLEQGIAIRGQFTGMISGRRPKIALRENEMDGFNPMPVKDDGSFEFWVGEPGEYEVMYESQENSYRTLPDPIKVKDRNPVEGLELKAP